MRFANVLFLLTFSIAQDMQIKYVTAYTIDVEWGGEIETVSEIIAAPGYAKFNGKLNPKRWIFRIFGGERGLIKVPGTDNVMGYSAKRGTYWVLPPGNFDLFADKNWGRKQNEKTEEKEKKDSKRDGQNPFSELSKDIFDNDDATPQIERILSDSIEIVNGFRTKKWTTTIATKSNRLVIEEWMVDALPLKDSLYSYLLEITELDTVENFNMPKFSSHDFIRGVDSAFAIPLSDESIVLAKLSIDSDNGWVESALFEIRELYTVPFDASSFTVPEEYERIEINQ